MTTLINLILFIFHGLPYRSKGAHYIPISDIDKFARVDDLNKGKGRCILPENPKLVEQGKGKYKLLGDPSRYLQDLKVANASTVLSVVLEELPSQTEKMVVAQSNLLPGLPLQKSLGDAAEEILKDSELFEFSKEGYPDLIKLKGITDTSVIINTLTGPGYTARAARGRRLKLKNAANDSKVTPDIESVVEKEPPPLPTPRGWWKQKHDEVGGYTFDEVLSVMSLNARKAFIQAVADNIANCTADDYYQKSQIWAKPRLESRYGNRAR